MLGGKYPFHNAATVGGGGFFSGQDAVRGFHPNRFIGDSAVWGNADLRLYLSRFFLALPGEWGLFGFGDVGRVWLEGETSDTWHTGWGGGLWIGLLSRSNAIAFTVAQSDERTAYYVRAGFSF
jgi:hemolysin activation/secretion protein